MQKSAVIGSGKYGGDLRFYSFTRLQLLQIKNAQERVGRLDGVALYIK